MPHLSDETVKSPVERREPLHPIVVTGAFDRIGIDFAGPFPQTTKMNKYVIVAIDYLTKWVEAWATIDNTAATTAKFLFQDIISRHGTPRIIQSDRGSHFVNSTIMELSKYFGITRKLTTSFHPQGNGLVERFNRTFKECTARCAQLYQGEWDEYLPAVLFAYTTMTQASTGYSPFYLVYGREALHPFAPNMIYEPSDELNSAIEERVKQLTLLSEIERKKALNSIEKSQKAQKLRYDYRRAVALDNTLTVGDKVLLLSGKDKTRNKVWDGIFESVKIFPNGTYQITVFLEQDIQIVHGNRLQIWKRKRNVRKGTWLLELPLKLKCH